MHSSLKKQNDMIYVLIILFTVLASSVVAQKTDGPAQNIYCWKSIEEKEEDTKVRRQVMKDSNNILFYFELYTSKFDSGKASYLQQKNW